MRGSIRDFNATSQRTTILRFWMQAAVQLPATQLVGCCVGIIAAAVLMSDAIQRVQVRAQKYLCKHKLMVSGTSLADAAGVAACFTHGFAMQYRSCRK